jgi:DNA transformation protein
VPSDPAFKDEVLDALQPLGDVWARAMFGGYGLYAGGLFFGLISGSNRLYFKTDPASREPYLARGMTPFNPTSTQTLYTYYAVPPDIQDDPASLVEWANAAIVVARRARAAQAEARSKSARSRRGRSTGSSSAYRKPLG